LTKRTKYALKALLHLAGRPPGESALIADIAAAEGIPRKFLEQILVALKREGLLESRMGKGGGYRLARPAERITFGEVMRLTEGSLAPVPCVSRSAYQSCEDCRDETACAIRAVMEEVREALSSVLDTTSLADGREQAAGHVRSRGITYTI